MEDRRTPEEVREYERRVYGEFPQPCPFCNYSGPSPILAGDATSIVIEPLNPVVPGHVLVIPRVHVEHFAEDIGVSRSVMGVAALWAWSHMGECNLITSRGRAASQSVMHLHVHLVPRVAGDGLALPWT